MTESKKTVSDKKETYTPVANPDVALVILSAQIAKMGFSQPDHTLNSYVVKAFELAEHFDKVKHEREVK